jgi:ketosteroid isomerase-like protein
MPAQTITSALGCALTTLAAWLGVVETAQASDDVAGIVDLEQRLARAWVTGDRTFIEGLLAPEWTVTDPSGRILTRQQVLDESFASAERRIDTMTVDDVNVRLMGTVAVATGRTRATGSYQGQVASVVLRFTDVFVYRDGRWQVVVSQGTMVAP